MQVVAYNMSLIFAIASPVVHRDMLFMSTEIYVMFGEVIIISRDFYKYPRVIVHMSRHKNKCTQNRFIPSFFVSVVIAE